jgi:hypothetical protein
MLLSFKFVLLDTQVGGLVKVNVILSLIEEDFFPFWPTRGVKCDILG